MVSKSMIVTRIEIADDLYVRIGSITGISSQQMAISEIGVAFPDDSWGDQSRFGYPFTVSFTHGTSTFVSFVLFIARIVVHS